MISRRNFLAALPAAGAAAPRLFAQASDAQSAPPIYDLLLKNGHVFDPKNTRNGRFDIAVIGNI